MTVNDELTCLLDGASKTCTQHQSVKTHFKELDQVLTGQASSTTCFFEDVTHLSLTNAVLSAQTLLLLQTNSVVRFLAATGTTVFAGTIRTLFEVTNSLRGESKAQRAGLAHLLA